MSAPAKSHRPEIDGLRAFAVLAVVLFHFSVPGFGGGFVGLDVFFVISGFLIGDILWRELSATGSISLKSFYYRRIKRLAPAFVAVALATFAVSYFVLLPYEFREFGKELISSTVYLSNVYYFMKAGYFDSAAEDKLFLHTSLSVEEQFYIFLPLTILLFLRSRKWLLRVLAAVFALSLLSKTISFRDLYYHDGQRFGAVAAMGIDATYGEIVHFMRAMLDRSAFSRHEARAGTRPDSRHSRGKDPRKREDIQRPA